MNYGHFYWENGGKVRIDHGFSFGSNFGGIATALEAQKVLLFSGNSPGARWATRQGSETARW